ncbi:two-component system response regulator BtsR [Moritella viscosa]|uniref:Response regulator n=1 Tax=Moritella viscosa TaxID=80854 RepID=A0A090ICB0_9GAMM|nr:two-component system response regulator BtsR [Moritella viscosa]CED59496.1 response regulator [Moritella viscosa]SGY86668.1 Response regulator [Moritella viscosa]SGY88035.1 Response regulator [Moritella viscosa]SGY88173.1 Response regulator [Moritella viscosa]SGY90000.1 Response regulator [Moritella viscosa]
MLNAIVIDDEQYAREELIELLHETKQIRVIQQAENAIEGLQLINKLKPDIIFLDIQMPQITGIKMLSMLNPDNMPKVVFSTAYDQYALQAFEENAFDYLLKPIDPARLQKTVDRLIKSAAQQNDSAIEEHKQLAQVPCIGHNRILIIATEDIEFAYSGLSGVYINTAQQETTSQLTLKVLEEKTPLIRCHRQYLVNLKAIKEIQLLDNSLAEIVTTSGKKLPVSRRYLKLLKQSFGIV